MLFPGRGGGGVRLILSGGVVRVALPLFSAPFFSDYPTGTCGEILTRLNRFDEVGSAGGKDRCAGGKDGSAGGWTFRSFIGQEGP